MRLSIPCVGALLQAAADASGFGVVTVFRTGSVASGFPFGSAVGPVLGLPPGQVLAAAAAQAQPLAQHGTNQHSEPEGEDLRTEGPKQWGETQTYLLRRLARDAPEILERDPNSDRNRWRSCIEPPGIISAADTSTIRRSPVAG